MKGVEIAESINSISVLNIGGDVAPTPRAISGDMVNSREILIDEYESHANEMSQESSQRRNRMMDMVSMLNGGSDSFNNDIFS
jgi:hypothetical protein